ncbi:hypothetical protein PAMC26510_16180 [Caballeronia sordidicola]|uniref:Uncharacterized protein n=1 Tax=Caballeronia sordidicola TaxID=196367 RepID=A0A242MSV4_CABSO|nr:hypothetical protein PAMC26577_31895 [Caballeronia sordidicola]OTP74466.1 hypothetical protein PAMC26510_16180 [Caballeronia sordidicola]
MFREFLYCARPGIEIVHSMRHNPADGQSGRLGARGRSAVSSKK